MSQQERQNKCAVIGVTGGIAAFKIYSLVSHLKQQGCEVHVLMTKEAEKFVTPLSFQALSGQKVITDMFTVDYTPEVQHIALAKKADIFVIAPATANIIAKAAHGIADDMLTTVFLAANCPKLIVPAMNTQMLMNPITQDNLALCRHYGMHVLESDEGYLACGDTGKGRLPEPEEIEDAMQEMLCTDKYLQGRKILVTAGPTQEALDPVRYLTNHSTGKMGYALARQARNAGAEVTLVAGPNVLDDIRGVKMIHTVSAADMAEAVLSRQDESDAMILAAAVADYAPADPSSEKIHKSEGDLSIACKRTVDILATLGKNKRPGQVLIGFSMETEKMAEHTKEKMLKKNCDFIVGNNLKEPGAGFGTDTNRTVIFGRETQTDLGLLSKEDTAAQILKQCLKEN
jgi:phosphopantothenoylcysteine decarboxylase/phosphopantothenate--cysteine ligase